MISEAEPGAPFSTMVMPVARARRSPFLMAEASFATCNGLLADRSGRHFYRLKGSFISHPGESRIAC